MIYINNEMNMYRRAIFIYCQIFGNSIIKCRFADPLPETCVITALVLVGAVNVQVAGLGALEPRANWGALWTRDGATPGVSWREERFQIRIKVVIDN